MRRSVRKHCNRHWYIAALLMLLGIAGLLPAAVMAQQASASINGVVKDQTGAAIANAQVELKNINTAVVRTTTTNTNGVYAFPNIAPGVYTMRAFASGFNTVTQPETTLEVNQTATFDFHLQIGATQETVTVNATAAAVETSTSELGTVVATKEVSDLPLNGRNFTQLLTITAGVANINRDQSSGGGGGWAGNSLGSYSFPAVNGARNRSNLFLLDGVNDLNTIMGMYNYSPIIDAIQEFKTQGHNDLAEYGGAAGGLVSVVTKSGANQYHGSFWEFLRNEQMDARGYFESSRTPLRQNQFGVSGGGPVWIPRLYNGRNRSFFYAAWEDFRERSAQTSGALGPTAEMREGNFSALSTTIYDPTTTTYDSTTGKYSRTAFPGNIIPNKRINAISSLFQGIIPESGTMANGSNVYVSGRTKINQSSGTVRGDQNFGNNNQIMFRYSQFDQTESTPENTIGVQNIHNLGHNYIGHWTHTYSTTAFSDVYFGRNYGDITENNTHDGEDAGFLSQLEDLGMSKYWMTLNNTQYAPQWSASGYVGLGGSQLQETGLADNWQFGGAFTKILGAHTIKVGADFQTNNFRSPIAYSSANFKSAQTAGLGDHQGEGGNSWASLLLGIPNEASYRNILEVAKGGWINGMFIQDQFKATSRLTINLGFRNDMVYTPIYGTGNSNNFYTGEANPVTGQYILNALPPDCSATQFAPCIPRGIYTSSSTPAATSGLPDHVSVTPNSDHRMIKNSLTDWAGRLGLAYRLTDKMAFRASYSRFYDAWATVIQLSQNFGGNWPAISTIDNASLNTGAPTAYASDPLSLGSSGSKYPESTFSSVSQWMVDPNFRTPYMDQWNIGIQRELPANAILDANYVGSVGRHLDWGPPMNNPQPGAGDITSRRPYPYMLPQWFDQSVGNSRYNALQITVNKRASHGVTFLLAYTLSNAKDDGCGLGANCNSSNPYNRSVDYGTSDLNMKHAFSASFTAQSPFTKSPNRLVAQAAGGWALNGIVQFSSGEPFTVYTSADPENIGTNLQERLNVVGKPNSGLGIHTAEKWFNTSAYALPSAYTYGNEKVNPLTSDHYRKFDLSLFRQFHVGLGEGRFFEFRAESFNLFNNPVFSIPNVDISGANFGEVTSQRGDPRQLQMGLKFNY